MVWPETATVASVAKCQFGFAMRARRFAPGSSRDGRGKWRKRGCAGDVGATRCSRGFVAEFVRIQVLARRSTEFSRIQLHMHAVVPRESVTPGDIAIRRNRLC